MFLTSRFSDLNTASLDVRLGILSSALRRTNRLAKELEGRQRGEEYQVKADLLSLLVLEGRVRANGVRADGKVCLDIFPDSPHQRRIHACTKNLHHEARLALEEQLSSVAVKCSIREHLESKRGGRDVRL